LCSSPDIITHKKSWGLSWAGHVASVGDDRKDRGVDERMGSEWILGTLAGEVWSGFNWLRLGAGRGLL
jgi:hypothetical protein